MLLRAAYTLAALAATTLLSSACATGAEVGSTDLPSDETTVDGLDDASAPSKAKTSGTPHSDGGATKTNADAGPPTHPGTTDAAMGSDAATDTGPPDAGTVTVPFTFTSDCKTVTCPASAPFPVGCRDTMTGGSTKGCVASTPSGSSVFFKEGERCDDSTHMGMLICSPVMGAGLNAQNCAINRSDKFYVTDKSMCPH